MNATQSKVVKVEKAKTEVKKNITAVKKEVLPPPLPTNGMIDLGEEESEDIMEKIGIEDGVTKKTDDIQSKIDLLE